MGPKRLEIAELRDANIANQILHANSVMLPLPVKRATRMAGCRKAIKIKYPRRRSDLGVGAPLPARLSLRAWA